LTFGELAMERLDGPSQLAWADGHESQQVDSYRAEATREAQARGRDAGDLGRALHLETDEVVGEGEAPEILRHADGALAADGLLALEHLGLHFVEAEFDFAVLVLERHDLLRRVLHGVEQGGQPRLLAEAAAPVPDGAHGPELRQGRLLAVRVSIHEDFG
jgi:hypothetical protein